MTFGILPEGVEESSHAKVRGKDSRQKKQVRRPQEGASRSVDRGFWGRASPGESGKVSGPRDSLGEDHSSLVGHRKELGFYV